MAHLCPTTPIVEAKGCKAVVVPLSGVQIPPNRNRSHSGGILPILPLIRWQVPTVPHSQHWRECSEDAYPPHLLGFPSGLYSYLWIVPTRRMIQRSITGVL